MLRLKRLRMSSPHYNLRNKHSIKETPIILYYKYSQELPRLKYSIKQTVLPKYWDQSLHRVKVSVNYPKHRRLNEILAKIEEEARRIVDKMPDIDHEGFKLELDYFLKIRKRPAPKSAPTFFEFLDQWIKDQTPIQNYRSIQKWKAVIGHLKAYAKTLESGTINYDDIDLVFKDSFAHFLKSQRKLGHNTRSKVIKNVKQLLTRAADYKYVNDDGVKVKYHDNDIIHNKKFKIDEIKTNKPALTFDELTTLYNYDLTKDESLSQVRDIFCIMAFSGLRISDVFLITKDSVVKDSEGNEYLHHFTYKGNTSKRDTEIYIPYRPELKSIFELYDFKLPQIAEQTLNKKIKIIGKKIGLDRVVLVRKKEDETTSVPTPIYELLSNHIGRYTYITMMINEFGVSPQDVQRITGQSLKVLMGYVQGDKKKAVARAAKLADEQITQRLKGEEE